MRMCVCVGGGGACVHACAWRVYVVCVWVGGWVGGWGGCGCAPGFLVTDY